MKWFIKIALLVLVCGTISAQSFKEQQLKFSRVKKAYEAKWAGLQTELKAKQIDPNNFEVFVRAFKSEGELEIWVKNKIEKTYTLLKKIPICASSGVLGPKRREGDGQVPEGIYDISVFNPNSNYFLALKVSYPNASDKILAKGPTGGDIMIHGNCVTIGCIPLQDEPVKDLYILCVEAKNRKLPIRVEIYPCHLNAANLAVLTQKFTQENVSFWNNIKTAYAFFEEHKLPISYYVDKKGNYVFPQ
jgi:murein L,D-transpeptidase YafK